MINSYLQFPLVKRLEMKNFRCFAKKIITFNDSTTLIEGHNGIGKTSILEALYYSCYLKSFRTASPKEMILFGAENFFIKVDIESNQEHSSFAQQVQIGFENGKRLVKIDGKPIHSYKELMGVLRVIGLTEDDMHLIKGAPQERRDFLDHAIILENGDYAQQLALLRQIILTRNNLLKSKCSPLSPNYRVVTEQLWDQSLVIQRARIQYISSLEQEITHLLEIFFQGELCIKLTYHFKKIMYQTFDLFISSYPTLLDMEFRLERSCFGAHLDDVLISYNSIGSRHFASRGQQKLILLLIKTAQVIALQRKGYQSAILFLLDDYMTDFDDSRSEALLKILQNLNVQLIFTSPTRFGPLSSKSFNSEGPFSRISL